MARVDNEFYTDGYNAYPSRRNYPDNVADETLWLRGWYDRRAEMTIDHGPDHASEGAGQITWAYLSE